MTLLEHEQLHRALRHPDLSKRLVVMPLLDEKQVGPASIDVRLGTRFQTLRRSADSGIDAGRDDYASADHAHEPVHIGYGEAFWLHPRQFVLGATLEFLQLPADVGAYVVGRSTWGRLGLIVATAIMIQPGWKGNLTLELVNAAESPIALYAGSRIAQLAVHSLNSETKAPYDGTYTGPTGPGTPLLEKEHREIERLSAVGQTLSTS